MRRREASINDVAIAEKDRRFRWAAPGPRPLRGKCLHTVKRKIQLHRHRLFAPQGAVVVEGYDAFAERHEVRRAGFGDLLDKIDDGLFRRTVIPRRQRIGSLRSDRGERQCADKRGDH